MEPGHSQYERFQSEVKKLSYSDTNNERWAVIRANAAAVIGAIGHYDGLEPLTAPEKGINDPDSLVRDYAARAIGAIAEAIKNEHPDNLAVIARQHVNPVDNPKAFITFYQALVKGEHLGQPPAWITTTAKQLKALEGNLKPE